MFILDIGNNDKGQLYTNKSPLSNGLFLNVKHTICNKLSLATKQINFTHLSFNRAGDRFLACDLHGSIYMFNLNFNRFMRLNRLGTTCTALAFNLKCKTEYLVACIDGTIKCFNTESRDLVGWMKGHEKPILSLSVHPTNADMVISFSADLAQLWDLKTFECKQKLNINSKKNVEIVKICFAPSTNDIVSVFKDDSIYVWQSETISMKCQFNVSDETNQVAKHFYRSLTISSDGNLLIVGSRFDYIHVFSIDTKKQQVIHLKNSSQTIKDCLILAGFCYDNKLLLVLTQEGLLDVYNVETGAHVADLNSANITHNQSQILNEQKLTQIFCSPNGRYLSAITHDGCIQVYDVDHSPVKPMKVTSGLMKSSINSTVSAVKTQIVNNEAKKEESLSCLLYKEKRNNVSKYHHEYPARYRMFIWKMILKLPENYESYAALVERGTHPAFVGLATKYPLKSQKCIRLLERTLSALGHWAPILAECHFLPILIFPFVKLFQNNQVVCFEIIASLLNNWCQHWFELFPNPPMNILNMIENLLAYHDRALLEHFMRFRITSQIYAWSLLETIFSEVFGKSDWQILFDNIFSNHPGFFLILIVAYSICNRTALLQVRELSDAQFFYHNQNPLSVHHLLQEAYKMQQTTPAEIDPNKLLNSFEPLSRGTYPVFNKRPKFITDYQIIEKTKILNEELNYLKEREAHLESHKLNEGRKLESEFLLKQMLWDTNHNKQFKESVEEYEKRQRNLEQMRLKKQQELAAQYNLNHPVKISVAGEPFVSTDHRGNNLFNKMKKIDENFEEIQNTISRAKVVTNGASSTDIKNNESDLDEDDLKEIESELIANRADALKISDEPDSNEAKKNAELNTNQSLSTSTILSWDRGRQNIENQEREVMKRVYDLRKNLAIESRKKNCVKTMVGS